MTVRERAALAVIIIVSMYCGWLNGQYISYRTFANQIFAVANDPDMKFRAFNIKEAKESLIILKGSIFTNEQMECIRKSGGITITPNLPSKN